MTMMKLILIGLVSALLFSCDGKPSSNSTNHALEEPTMALSEILDLLPDGWEVTYAKIGDLTASEVQFKSPQGDYYKGDQLAGSREVITLTGDLHAQLPIGFMKSLEKDNRIEIIPGSGVATLKGKWEVEPFGTTGQPVVPAHSLPQPKNSEDPASDSPK